MERLTVRTLQKKVALHRDEQAYKALFIHFYKTLLPFALSFLKSTPLAEETVSDVMLNIWQLEERLTAVDDLKSYLLRAVKNRALNRLARDGRTVAFNFIMNEEGLPDESPDPFERMQKAELQRCLFNAVAGLPPRCRAVYQLVKEEGLSYREAASILSISENTVDRQLNNALHKLIAALQAHLGEGHSPQKKFTRRMGSRAAAGVLTG